jgi:hypothetical protein
MTLRMGDANEIMGSLSKKDEQKMINEGLLKNNYTAFWEINQDFQVKHIADFRRYAIRVLSNTHHTFVQLNKTLTDKPVSTEGSVEELSPEFQKWLEAEESITLGQVLIEAFPKLFVHDMGEDDEMVVAPANPAMEVLTHGVKVDMNTSVYWMQLNLSYPDGFIYLSFHYI